jgi:hypothetical protein
MASAWLIRRFIDSGAKFRFTDEQINDLRKREVPFDTYGAELGHQGDRCTFETLCDRFGIDDPAVRHIATIVHDIDFKEQRYSSPEGPVVASVIRGLQTTYADDHELLQHGIALFAGLYQSRARQNGAKNTIARRPRARPR